MAKKIKLSEFERKRPLKLVREGRPITFERILRKEVEKDFDFLKLDEEISELNYEDKKNLALERYKMIPEDYNKITYILGQGSHTIQQDIEEIEKDSDYGKELIEMEMQFISRLIRKYKKGEIE